MVQAGMKIADLSVYGVHPARSAGHLAILEPLRHMARLGHSVEILSLGLRSFERRWPRRFRQEIAEGLQETRLVSARALLKAQLSRKTRFPPIEASRSFARLARPEDRSRLSQADLVIIESPWAYDFARSQTQAPILWIAHNQEVLLHRETLMREELLDRARETEGRCFRTADLVLALHDADAEGLQSSYGPRQGPLEVLPLGCEIRDPTDQDRRVAARQQLGLEPQDRVALFAGSAHEPNVRAAEHLEALGPDLVGSGWQILIAGSVCPSTRSFPGGKVTGPLESLEICYEAADLALNPVEAGSGMNVKNLHAMAWGLPVLCSPIGARGFQSGTEFGLLEVGIRDLVGRLRDLGQQQASLEALAAAAHRTARNTYSWSAIVDSRLAILARHLPVEPRSR